MKTYCTRKSCNNMECEVNRKHVKATQSGVEYYVKALFGTAKCKGYRVG